MIEGNAAAALGYHVAGVTVVTWYPINALLFAGRDAGLATSSGSASTRKQQGHLRVCRPRTAGLDRMALGAGWAGARSMTFHRRTESR